MNRTGYLALTACILVLAGAASTAHAQSTGSPDIDELERLLQQRKLDKLKYATGQSQCELSKGVKLSSAGELIGPKVDDKRAMSPDDYYPASSRRAEEQGTVVLELCVLPSRTIASIHVVKSSGYPRLDEAAIAYARDLPITPGRVYGQPAALVLDLNVRFQLKK